MSTRLHAVEFLQSTQLFRGSAKRFANKDCKLERQDDGSVLATPHPSHLTGGIAPLSHHRPRLFASGAVFWAEPMTEDELAEVEKDEDAQAKKYAAEQERQKKLREAASKPQKSPQVTLMEALAAQLAELQKQVANPQPVLTAAPAVRSQRGEDTVKIVKDPESGKLVEVRGDGTREEVENLPPSEPEPEAAPAESAEMDALKAQVAQLQAALKAQAQAEVVQESAKDPVAAVAEAKADAEDDE